jgi:hypothetical protein
MLVFDKNCVIRYVLFICCHSLLENYWGWSNLLYKVLQILIDLIQIQIISRVTLGSEKWRRVGFWETKMGEISSFFEVQQP